MPHSPAPAAGPPWLIPGKVAVPEPLDDHLHRPALLKRIDPTARPATVLKAPGGFGKTTLLATSCRALREAGVLAAWLTLDVPDAPQVLETYLAYAFQAAGLRLTDGSAPAPAERALDSRLDVLMQALARHEGRCVLFLDELERLADPQAIETINVLIQWRPSNLSLAMACRDFPATLDIGSSVLAGRTALFDVSALRFSDAEATAFVGSRVARDECSALLRQCGGWPIALRILMHERMQDPAPDAGEVAGNWVTSRLWRGLDATSRDLLMDLGLFEQFDDALVDEVLGGAGLMQRIAAMPAVAGLIESVSSEGSRTRQLHPLVREHCTAHRLRETPERYRAVNLRLAEALAQRGETVAAMRHAAAAGEPELVAQILEAAGAVRLWQLEGPGCLQAADRYLTPEIRAGHPRLALAHCVALLTAGRLEEARREYQAVADRRDEQPPEPSAVSDFDLEDCSVRGMLYLYGCELLDAPAVRPLLDDLQRYADMPEVPPEMRGWFQLGLCIAHNLTANFDGALQAAQHAERILGRSPYVHLSTGMYCGQVDMAQGRAREAASHYADAYRLARAGFLRDPGLAVFVETLIRELDLERHRAARLERAPIGIPKALYASGTPLGCFAAASATALELTRRRNGLQPAIDAAAELREYARSAALPALVRYLAGLHVALLARAGRIGEAERAWRLAGLPAADAACLDLDGQSWREMESLASGRLRLLTAAGRHEDARTLAGALLSTAEARGLRRTQMRGLLLAAALERDAAQPAAAEARLAGFLRLYAETAYAGPAVGDREAVSPVLESLLGGRPEADVKAPGEALLGVLRGRPPAATHLSPRERQILNHLDILPDKGIAERLGLSVPGVRYHVSSIFKKLGVNDRSSAVDRARDARRRRRT